MDVKSRDSRSGQWLWAAQTNFQIDSATRRHDMAVLRADRCTLGTSQMCRSSGTAEGIGLAGEAARMELFIVER